MECPMDPQIWGIPPTSLVRAPNLERTEMFKFLIGYGVRNHSHDCGCRNILGYSCPSFALQRPVEGRLEPWAP